MPTVNDAAENLYAAAKCLLMLDLPLRRKIFCATMRLSFYGEEVICMSAYCEICQKGAMSGMNVSHSHLKTKRKWKPNIQRVRALVDGEVKRVNVCTRCLRSGKIQRAI